MHEYKFNISIKNYLKMYIIKKYAPKKKNK